MLLATLPLADFTPAGLPDWSSLSVVSTGTGVNAIVVGTQQLPGLAPHQTGKVPFFMAGTALYGNAGPRILGRIS